MRKKKFSFKDFCKSRKVIAVFLIALSIIIGFIGGIVQYNMSDKESAFLEFWYYSSQIISSIFMTSGVIIAVWQYYLSSKSMKNNLEIQQVQRAIDLAEYYKDNILRYSPAIKYVFEKTDILSIINNLRIDHLHDFDVHELNKLFTQNEIDKLKNLKNSDLFYQSVLDANTIYGLGANIPDKKEEISAGKEEIKGVDDKDYATDNSLAPAFLANLIKDMLNNLEYFALHFHHNTADESVVYQSLHQTYLEIIRVLYYFISKQNEDASAKYYTNIIWLFEKWGDKKTAQNNERSQKSKEIQSHGTVVGE